MGTGRPEESGPTRPVGRSPAIHSSPPHATDSPRPRSEQPALWTAAPTRAPAETPLRRSATAAPRLLTGPDPGPLSERDRRDLVAVGRPETDHLRAHSGRGAGAQSARARSSPLDVGCRRGAATIGRRRASLRNDGLGPRQGTRDCVLGTSAAVLRTRLVAATQPKEDGPPDGIPLRWGSPPGGISADGSQPRDQLNRWSDDGPRTAIAARWAGVP